MSEDKITMNENKFEIKINVPLIKELVSDKIYRSDASALREQYVNALSHGCVAYHEKNGYTDDVYVQVIFDYGLRKVTIRDNGTGMSRKVFEDNFMSFGFSTVDDNENNSRSGMFGLGAISFFRIASACIVESWHRDTDERFTFLTHDTENSEMIENCSLEEYGTETQITLKPHVNIKSLVDMVKRIASNYPVKTVLEVINAESEQNISSYRNEDEDTYLEFASTMTFKEYVDKETNGRNVQIADTDEMEMYLSTQGRNNNYTYLCRVPIDMDFDSDFVTYVNIKKEKIPGEDSKGKPKLQEVPKPDRDSVNEISETYFDEKIQTVIKDMLWEIDVTTMEGYLKSDSKWILNGYGVDDKLNSKTHNFIQKLREPVKYRTNEGIQKRLSSYLDLFGTYESILFHPSLHKGTYVSINAFLKKEAWKKAMKDVDDDNKIKLEDWSYNGFVMVDTVLKEIPIESAKNFKKMRNVPNVSYASKGGSNGSLGGLLVRSGDYNNYRISVNPSQAEITSRYPGGLYYGSGLQQGNLYYTQMHDLERQKHPLHGLYKRSKIGIVCARTGEKHLPSIRTLQREFITAWEEGKIVLNKRSRDNHYEEPTREKGEWTVNNVDSLMRQLADYYTLCLPIQYNKIDLFNENLGVDILYMPAKFIHMVQILTMAGQGIQNTWKHAMFIKSLKYIPNWHKADPKMLASVIRSTSNMYRGYGNINSEMVGEIINQIFLIRLNDLQVSEDRWDEFMTEMVEKYPNSCNFRLEYKHLFPNVYLINKALQLGYEREDIEENPSDPTEVWAYGNTFHRNMNYIMPTKINNELCWVVTTKEFNPYNESFREAISAALDDEGKPVIKVVGTIDNSNVVERNGKLQVRETITEWT